LNFDKAIKMTDEKAISNNEIKNGIAIMGGEVEEHSGYYFEDEDIWVNEFVYLLLKNGSTIDECEKILKDEEILKHEINYDENFKHWGKKYAEKCLVDPRIYGIIKF